MAVLVAGFLAFLLRQSSGAESQTLRAPILISDPEAAVQSDPSLRAPFEESAETSSRTTLPGPNAEVESSYRLELRVVDRQGRPVQRASALVTEPDDSPGRSIAAAGIATIDVSRLGPHVLEVAGPDSDDYPFIEASVRWTPDAEVPVSEIEVVLHRAARIQGSLQCSDGSSAASAGIDIFHVETKEWSNAAAIEDGTFVSQWLPAGEVVVYSRNGSWSSDDLREREVIHLVEGQTYAYRGTLAPAISLEGTVVDGAGRPRPNTPVDIYDALNPQYSESVLSSDDGRFYYDALYPGTYLLDLPKATATSKTLFTVERGSLSRHMGQLIHRGR